MDADEEDADDDGDWDDGEVLRQGVGGDRLFAAFRAMGEQGGSRSERRG